MLETKVYIFKRLHSDTLIMGLCLKVFLLGEDILLKRIFIQMKLLEIIAMNLNHKKMKSRKSNKKIGLLMIKNKAIKITKLMSVRIEMKAKKMRKMQTKIPAQKIKRII